MSHLPLSLSLSYINHQQPHLTIVIYLSRHQLYELHNKIVNLPEPSSNTIITLKLIIAIPFSPQLTISTNHFFKKKKHFNMKGTLCFASVDKGVVMSYVMGSDYGEDDNINAQLMAIDFVSWQQHMLQLKRLPRHHAYHRRFSNGRYIFSMIKLTSGIFYVLGGCCYWCWWDGVVLFVVYLDDNYNSWILMLMSMILFLILLLLLMMNDILLYYCYIIYSWWYWGIITNVVISASFCLL